MDKIEGIDSQLTGTERQDSLGRGNTDLNIDINLSNTLLPAPLINISDSIRGHSTTRSTNFYTILTTYLLE